ncbi:hypothetical protein V4838_005235, partial [Escherichia coli]|nr:hypothetical protein [Escherichia coli]EKS0334843.1 hypothetical protein [Escherichia coli]
FVAGTSPPWTADTCCGHFSPRKVHSGKQAAGVAVEGQTTAPSGAVSLHTVRCAGSAGHGATEAARPERSLQAWFFRHRTVAAARNRASGFGGDWRVRQQLPVGVGPDDRMPPGSREPKVSPPPGVRTTETTKQKNASHHDGQEGQRRRRGPPVFQAGVSLPGFSGGPAGHTPAGAGE